MNQGKSQAVAQIVSAILAKPGIAPTGAGGRPSPNPPEGFTLTLEEAKIFLHDHKGNKMALEELIQYVDRYLG